MAMLSSASGRLCWLCTGRPWETRCGTDAGWPERELVGTVGLMLWHWGWRELSRAGVAWTGEGGEWRGGWGVRGVGGMREPGLGMDAVLP